ncbi:MAG: DHH family phosphoesterase, partial [Halocynthiibacter sp.]
MAFLGVQKSLRGRCWVGPGPEVGRVSQAMQQTTDLPGPLCQTLARLGVPANEAELYLNPRLRDLLPDPRGLRDMERAAGRFVTASLQGQKIAVFADYDVDGGASAALLLNWLRAMGRDATLYVPDRIEEGYGPNTPAMQKLAHDHDLIICVDCGTLSHQPIAAATDADVIVLDHHLGGETLPAALAVVNPNRQDESGALAHLCAAAVVFLMLVEANRQLRVADKTGPDLMAMLDLVALAREVGKGTLELFQSD